MQMRSKPTDSPNEAAAPVVTRKKVLDVLDVTAKLITAVGIITGAWIAHNFQASSAATAILSQREQADSTLRVQMFHDLIGPIVGDLRGPVDPMKERLLAELLALNFHEHFEFKPLMIEVDEKLSKARIKSRSSVRDAGTAREELRSIARRVTQRQLALLEKADGSDDAKHRACIYRVVVSLHPDASPATISADGDSRTGKSKDYLDFCRDGTGEVRGQFNELLAVTSPSRMYKLALSVAPPEKWENQAFDVSIRVSTAADGSHARVVADHDFNLTWYDFPFTDNTLLGDGTRFALILEAVEAEAKLAKLKLVWFPHDYFSERERPTNHREFRKKLGLQVAG